jgi:hypothetical protein
MLKSKESRLHPSDSPGKRARLGVVEARHSGPHLLPGSEGSGAGVGVGAGGGLHLRVVGGCETVGRRGGGGGGGVA